MKRERNIKLEQKKNSNRNEEVEEYNCGTETRVRGLHLRTRSYQKMENLQKERTLLLIKEHNIECEYNEY